MMRRQILLAAQLLLLTVTAHAGGPGSLAGATGNTPVTYPNGGQGIVLNYDQNNLGPRTKAQADAIVNQALALWNNVPSATVTLTSGATLPVDVTVANYAGYIDITSDGLNPVIYDADGSITDAYLGVGSKDHVLGFAGSSYRISSATFTEGDAVINGPLTGTHSDGETVVLLAHELGHFIGLDHTQLDNTQGLAAANYPVMYPYVYRSIVSMHADDIAAVSALYPVSNIGASYGSLSGVFTQVSAAPILGANLWAREVNTGQVYSIVSDYLMQGTGYFRMLLPPGVYTLSAESIQSEFDGGSSVGPYADTITSASFLSPHPITPVTFRASTPGTNYRINITAGCSANVNFRLDGSGAVTSSNCLATAPSITGFWPGAGTVNTRVFVFGTNFVPGPGATTVKINGINVPIMQVVSSDLLLFLLPAGNTSGPITVTTAQGSATTTSSFGLPLTGVKITGLWPTQGPVGTIAFVFGSGFVPNQTQVSFNQTPAPILHILDASLLLAVVPPGATTGPIRVTTPQGSATSAIPFTVRQ